MTDSQSHANRGPHAPDSTQPSDLIPSGPYCYEIVAFATAEDGTPTPKTRVCPFWERRVDEDGTSQAYCAYLDEGEDDLLLLDQVKVCGVNDPDGEAEARPIHALRTGGAHVLLETFSDGERTRTRPVMVADSSQALVALSARRRRGVQEMRALWPSIAEPLGQYLAGLGVVEEIDDLPKRLDNRTGLADLIDRWLQTETALHDPQVRAAAIAGLQYGLIEAQAGWADLHASWEIIETERML